MLKKRPILALLALLAPLSLFCKAQAALIDLATGGGWPVDLSQCQGVADMYIDYVRVYGRGKP